MEPANRLEMPQAAEKGLFRLQMKLLSPKLNKIFILFSFMCILKTSSSVGMF